MHKLRLSTRLRSAPTRYRPLELIAEGGMAEVWRSLGVFENGDTHPVAIKRVLPSLATNSDFRAMFEDEARLGMLLRHPNIVRVYDARDISGTFIMVMELVDGPALHELTVNSYGRTAPIPLGAALHVMRCLAEALDYAHNARDKDGAPMGVIHRDVSPHNILLRRDGQVKLVDFGLADANVHATVRGDAMVGGKLGYMAPEVAREGPATHRVDLFSAGVVLWEMLTGLRLFTRDQDIDTFRAVRKCHVPPLRKHNPSVPTVVEDLALRLLESDPDKRIASAASLKKDLAETIKEADCRAGEKDVALLVELFRASRTPHDDSHRVPTLLEQQLARFAEETSGVQYEMPLATDVPPSDFW